MTDKAMVAPQMILDTAAWSQSEQDLRDTLRMAAHALSAALAQAEQPVAVKPLEWESSENTGLEWAESIVGQYRVHRGFKADGRSYPPAFRFPRDSEWTTCGSFEDAKAHAQADFNQRILSALSPSKIEAGENTAETPPPGSRLRGIVEAFLHAHFDGPGLIDAVDNYGDRYTSQFLADTIERARAALATTEGSDNG